MEETNLRKLSRRDWTSKDGGTTQNIRTGTYLRIADALENIVQHYRNVSDVFNNLERQNKELTKENRRLKRLIQKQNNV